MPLLLAAKVWHYWLSIFLLGPIVLILIGFGIAYLLRVKALRYPRR